MKKFLLLLCPAALASQTIRPYLETYIEHGIKTDSIVLVDNEKTNIYITSSGKLFVPVKTENAYRRIYLGEKPRNKKTKRQEALAVN